MGWQDRDEWPKVVEDMREERRARREEGGWGLLVTCGMVALVVAVGCVLAGCAVSLSFQPASWSPANGKAQAETRAK